MSDNKFKYFTVESVVVVKANNKSDAEKLASGRRGVQGEVILKTTDVERITAIDINYNDSEISVKEGVIASSFLKRE